MSLKIQHLEIFCETKTKDNVFITVTVAVQYRVVEEKVSSAYYKLSDHVSQIRSYVNDVVRSSLPSLELDHAYESKDSVAHSVRDRLSLLMSEYGYEILAALVIDISPAIHVKDAMNEINASQRRREAASEKAEAEKILQVKSAEAEAESKYLLGVGVARQRRAIVDGLRETVNGFSGSVQGTSPKDVMDLLLLTQYFETIREVGKGGADMGHENTLFLPHGPHSIEHLKKELSQHFLSHAN